MALTGKQEKFAQLVASGVMDQSAAYRLAYDAAGSSDTTVRKRASELMHNKAITDRVAELREPEITKAGITLGSHLAELEKLRDAAAESGQFSAAISAEIARGKVCGLYTDKVALTGADGGPVQVADMSQERLKSLTDDELAAFIELRKKMGP